MIRVNNRIENLKKVEEKIYEYYSKLNTRFIAEVYNFFQLWSNSSLGFDTGGNACLDCMMNVPTTVVVSHDNDYKNYTTDVFFNGDFAYNLVGITPKNNETLREDIINHSIKSISNSDKYLNYEEE